MPDPAPTAPGERLLLLDSLRGFALAGVLLANLTAFSLYFFLPSASILALPLPLANRLLDPLLSVFVSSKFITLFSLMFGIGFTLQVGTGGDANADGGDRIAARRYLRRLLVLLAIGLVHASLVWWGDVLRYYAVIGMLLVLVRRWPPRRLLAVGVALVVLPHSLVAALTGWPAVQTQATADAAALTAFASPHAAVFLAGNLRFGQWWLLAHWAEIPWIAGCLAIGVAFGRMGMLHRPRRHRRFWRRLAGIALPLGLTLSLALEAADYRAWAWFVQLQSAAVTDACVRVLRDAAVLTLGLGYMAGFVLLFAHPAARRLLGHLAPVGRMALSNYLTHSLLGVAVFYGIGLGLGPRGGLPAVVLAWLAIFGAQIALSRWWLARCRFGPAEWLWRSLTYGRRQPMRLKPSGTPATAPAA